jgi:hypothetical protein
MTPADTTASTPLLRSHGPRVPTPCEYTPALTAASRRQCPLSSPGRTTFQQVNLPSRSTHTLRCVLAFPPSPVSSQIHATSSLMHSKQPVAGTAPRAAIDVTGRLQGFAPFVDSWPHDAVSSFAKRPVLTVIHRGDSPQLRDSRPSAPKCRL